MRLNNVTDGAPVQLTFYATAAESLAAVQGEIEELSVAAEGEYRYTSACSVESFADTA